MNVTISPRPNSPAGKGCATLFLSCFAIAGLVFTALMVKVGFETIAGAVLWELEKVPALAEVRLIGFTRGKGTGDGATVETVTFDAGARRRHPRVQLRRAERTLQFLRYTHRAPLGRRVRREAGPRIPAHRDHDRTWSGGDHTAANRAARAQRTPLSKDRQLIPPLPCGDPPARVIPSHAFEQAQPARLHGRCCDVPPPRQFPDWPQATPRRIVMTARDNPFAASHLESIPFRFPSGVDWEVLLKKLEAQNWCASIVGGHGTGKTTLLEQLIPHLTARGFEPVLFRLQTESGMKEKDRLPDKLREIKAPGFILLDGAEQLSTRQWLPIRGAASEAAGFIVTVHRTSRLPVALELETSAKLLESLVGTLTGGKLPDEEAEVLFNRHRGNLRECLRELHDRWAG